MADYLSDPNQPPAQIAPLGSGGLAALAGGQLVVVPALPDSESNWYYKLLDPGYSDYYDWLPGQSSPSQPAGQPPTGTISALVAPSSSGGSYTPSPTPATSTPAASSG